MDEPRYILSDTDIEHTCCFNYAIFDTHNLDILSRPTRICEIGEKGYAEIILNALNAQ